MATLSLQCADREGKRVLPQMTSAELLVRGEFLGPGLAVLTRDIYHLRPTGKALRDLHVELTHRTKLENFDAFRACCVRIGRAVRHEKAFAFLTTWRPMCSSPLVT